MADYSSYTTVETIHGVELDNPTNFIELEKAMSFITHEWYRIHGEHSRIYDDSITVTTTDEHVRLWFKG